MNFVRSILNLSQTNLNSFEVKVSGGKSRVYAILGSALFNGTAISAGEYFPPQPKNTVEKKPAGENGGMLIGLLLGAVGGGVLLAIVSASGGSNNTVSTVR